MPTVKLGKTPLQTPQDQHFWLLGIVRTDAVVD